MASEQPAKPPASKPIARRDFIKTSVRVAAGGAILAGAAPVVVPLSYNPIKRKRFPFIGARIFPPGPAPQGIPAIPVRVNKDGVLEGVPEADFSVGGTKHSLEWYKYCSHEKAPGLEPDFTDDNTLEYFALTEKIGKAKEQGIDLWYKDLLGQKVLAEHFTQVGMGAPFRWRSQGQEQTNIVTGIVMKINPDQMKGKVPEGIFDKKNGFVAFCSFCAHFCCVPGYAENNSDLTKFGFRKTDGNGEPHEVIYCSCHDSRYDPLDLRQYEFPPDF